MWTPAPGLNNNCPSPPVKQLGFKAWLGHETQQQRPKGPVNLASSSHLPLFLTRIFQGYGGLAPACGLSSGIKSYQQMPQKPHPFFTLRGRQPCSGWRSGRGDTLNPLLHDPKLLPSGEAVFNSLNRMTPPPEGKLPILLQAC